MGSLTLYKKVTCNNGDTVTVVFEPDYNYKPVTAFTESTGNMIAYIDNIEICKMKIESVFKAINELALMDLGNFIHAELVITGLLKYTRF